jgi:NAD(P)-dependent dehydrogenase (short-subunit alcohol dehydrogenase family)
MSRFITKTIFPFTRNELGKRSLSFQPPPPNEYTGIPVYSNIEIHGSKDSQVSPLQIRKKDPDAVYVVTGASRSMGLQYVKELLKPERAHESSKIIACCRSPTNAVALNDFLNSLSPCQQYRIEVQKLDVTSDDDIHSLATHIKDVHNRVDILFNVAGVLGDAKMTSGPERNISQFDRKWFQTQMDINAIGPMMLTKALFPYMKVSSKHIKDGSRAPSVVLNMSARVGSIADNTGGLGWHSYRMSKASLNMGTRTLSHELKRSGIWTIALYPGFTDTDMSTPFQRPGMKEKGMVFPVDFTVGRMLDVMEGMREDNSGGFYDWSGIALPF